MRLAFASRLGGRVAAAIAALVLVPAVAWANSGSLVKISGDNQSAVAGTALPAALVVEAKNSSGHPVANVTIHFSANNGGSVSPTSAVTNAQGQAQTTVTLGATPGTTTITCTANGYTQTSFTATGTPVPTKLVFTTEPSNATAGVAISPAVVVTCEDSAGRTATSFNGSVTIAFGANPGGSTLSGTTTLNASSGVATFSTLSLNKAATGYTLTASATSLTSGTSSTFNIVPASASALVFSTQPSNVTAGSAISPAVGVTAHDAFGNTVTSFTGNVTVALGANPGGSTLSGTTTVAASSGVATFSTLSLNKAASGYTLAASASGLTGATSSGFNVVAAAASALVFSTQPSNETAGSAISPAVGVTAQDAYGNTATSFTGNVMVALGANPGGSTLSGTATVAASSGVATFSTLSLNKAASSYTLTASATGLTGATSASFNVVAGSATSLVFSTQPSNATAGSAVSPAVTVTAQDALGNTATSFTGNVTVALGANPGGSTLSGTTTVAASSGVATFSTLSLNKAASGYTLTASATGVGQVQCLSFTVNAGPATTLLFTNQPSNLTAGGWITPTVSVTALDSLGNTATSFTGNVTVALGNNPGGSTLSGPTTVAASSGLAQFTQLSLNKSGSGYTLTASATGLSTATSAPFSVSPSNAGSIVFTTQPTNTTAGSPLSPAVVLTAYDAYGNVATGFNGTVSMRLGEYPTGTTLGGTTSVNATNGIATFSNLILDTAFSQYYLIAGTSFSSPSSATFAVSPGPAVSLVFVNQPTNVTAGSTISPQVVVYADDAYGNLATSFTGTVSVAVGNNPGGSTLSGSTTYTPTNGVALFNTLSLNKAGNGYTLTATASGLSAGTSASFNVVPAAASALVFSNQPSTVTAGSAIAPAVGVTAQDAFGNTATSFTGNVTVALGANPGGSTLSGTTTLTASSGVAMFSGLSLNKSASGYTLTASASGPSGATSSSFSVVAGPASALVFSAQPSTATAGAAVSPAVVTAQDALGNTATSFTGNVTVGLGANPGGATLSGTTTVAASSGSASFSTLSLNKAGSGYALAASASGLSGATSASFNVVAAAAATLVFSTQPSSAMAGAAISPAVVATAQDAFGNTATSFAGNVTVAIGTNPGGSTLSGTTTVAASSGAATFSTLSLNKAASGYALTASATGLGGATSTAFAITAGPASALIFSVQPSNVTAGSAITPAVAAQDAFGNAATSFTGNVTIAIGTNPGGSTLSGTTTVAASSGVATFAGLSLNVAATGYTLAASASGLSGATSSAFSVVAGAASALVFSAQPSNVTAGASVSPAVVVTAQDAFGNTATSFTANVTVALAANPGGSTLSGTTTVAASSGSASFSTLSLNKAASGYTLAATATGLTGATSASFNVVAAAAAALVFSTQPSSATAGVAISPAVVATAQDAFGNTATSFTGNVTIAIGTNPGGSTLSGTTTVAASSGSATFSTLSLNKAASGYALTASATGLSGATSTAFTITAGPASALIFSVQPSNVTAGSAIAPAVGITAQDALGNTATSFGGNVTVALGANPGGSTLSGTTTVAASSGVATLSGLSLNKAASGYTLTASASGLTGATSASFGVVAGPASALVFSTQPSNATAGVAVSPAVVVTAQDALGNTATSFTGNVTVALGANPGGSTLSGTTTVAASSGSASFSNLSLNMAASGYTLAASATGLSGATSAGFNVVAAAASALVFSTQPSNATAGAAVSPGVVVTAQDAFGNTATSFGGNVTVAIGTNPGGSTLSGTTTVAASSGAATFSTLSLNKAASGYTITASATGLTGATSTAFAITAGPASAIVFSVQPSSVAAGSAIAPAVAAAAQDAFGNAATSFTGNVTVALGNNPGGATLSGTTTVAAASGVATFSNLSLNIAGSGYTLTAAATGLTGATSSGFTVTGGAAASLVFTTQPSNATAGSAISPAVVVTAQDAFGNTATFSGNVTVALGANPGSSTLSGTTTVAASSGVATFSTLSLNKATTGYTLVASSTGLTGATSNGFNVIAAAAAALTFSTQPSNATAGTAISPAVVVTAQDAFGNAATTYTGNVTVAIGVNPGGSTLSGTTTVAAASGAATFSTLSLNKVASGYTLTASSTGLTGATSSTFAIAAGSPSALVFSVQPSNVTAGSAITPAVAVAAQDAFGNAVTTYAGNVTVAIGANPGSSTLSGTTTVAATSGVATFASLSLNMAASGYTLTASATGLSGATSSTFNVTAGPAASLAFTTQPSNATAGSAISPSVAVTAQDSFGNTATFSGNVTVALGANPGGATLSGTTTVAASAGVATFAGLSLDKAASGYTLGASATGLTGGTSSTFTITAGAAAALSFAVQPSRAPALVAIAPSVQVTVLDAHGNTVTTATNTVTLSIASNNGAQLAGSSVHAASGVATFASLSVDRLGAGYTLTAAATGLTSATSSAFSIGAFTAFDGLGQLEAGVMDFAGNTPNAPAATAVQSPSGVALDATGHRLYVADSNNNRILVFPLSATNDFSGIARVASFVIGQPDFYTTGSPPAPSASTFGSLGGLAFDAGTGLLWVADWGNSRILAFDTTQLANGMNASWVLGWSNFTNRPLPGQASANSLFQPSDVAIDSAGQRLFVCDSGDNRVLVFSTASLSNGKNASWVLGQQSFTTTSATYVPNANGQWGLGFQSQNGGLTFDSVANRLYVSDVANNRVLVFSTSSLSNGMNASWVLGQPDFNTDNSPWHTGSQSGLSPGGLRVDPVNGRLYACDTGNDRILVFPVSSITNGENASYVLGQSSFSGWYFTVPAQNTFGATMLEVDGNNHRLYVGDGTCRRVLFFDTTTLSNGMNAFDGLGHLDANGNMVFTRQLAYDSASAGTLSEPAGLAIDSTGHRLFVADTQNGRVLVYQLSSSNDVSTGRLASVVLGEPDFVSIADQTYGSTGPFSVLFDAPNDRLYVGWRSNVAVYDASNLSNGVSPIANIWGGTVFVTGLALDSAGQRLFFSDSDDNRVLAYDVSHLLTTGASLLAVLGQPNTTSTSSVYPPTASSLSGPEGLAYDPATSFLYVADYNNRVLVFQTTTLTTGMAASWVIGQPNFTTVNYGAGPNQLIGPRQLALDAARQRLLVAEGNGQEGRILFFPTSSLVNGESAVQVIGQDSLYGRSYPSTGPAGFLEGPQGVCIDPTDPTRVFVSDANTSRVLLFRTP